MKIAVIGFSGSGKSTVARRLGELTGAEVLHLDTVQFLPDWKIRPLEEKEAMVQVFLDTHSAWIVEGNYTKLSYERRLEEADQIWILLFDRITRFSRIVRRYRKYRGKSREDMAEGCTEKLDRDFAGWVLWRGCTPERKRNMHDVVRRYPAKSHLFTNQHQVDTALRLFERGQL